MKRKTFLMAAASVAATSTSPFAAFALEEFGDRLVRLEQRSGGRLGVYARDLGSGRVVAHCASERFPMCSTFKTLAVSAVLQRVDRGRERLDRLIRYGEADLQSYAPETRANLARGAMSVRDLCAAAMVDSDNTAANLLLASIGGPHAVTAFVRSNAFGDAVTRLDRNEPSLNTAIPGDPRDTTTPAHIANDLARLLTGDAILSPISRRMLEAWMRRCRTGTAALRAGVPKNWIVGDKTGSGDDATRNDLAIFRPPHGAPIVVAAYLTQAHALDGDGRDALLADVARAVIGALT